MEKRAEADNLVGIYAALAGSPREQVLRNSAARSSPRSRPRWSTSRSRKPLADQRRAKRLTQDPLYIDSVLSNGADRARAIAAETMGPVKDMVGLVRGEPH